MSGAPQDAHEPTEASTVAELDRAMMARALDLAREAMTHGEVPVGAVVYETVGGRVLGEGFNQRERDADPSAHAEHLAIVRACRAISDWRLPHCSLAVTLEPCPMCAGLIVNARVGRVLFGAMDPKAGACGSLMRLTEDPRLNHRVTPIAGVMAEDAASLLREFFKLLRQ
jgi:tRNA(adenine34) deaminase